MTPREIINYIDEKYEESQENKNKTKTILERTLIRVRYMVKELDLWQ